MIEIRPLEKELSYPESMEIMEDARRLTALDAKTRLLAFEYGKIITLGRRLRLESYPQNKGFTYHQANRGGEATLHDRGQLVIYPIVNLKSYNLGVRDFVCKLEKATKSFFKSHAISCYSIAGKPGLFTDHGKIMSIGLRVREGVSTHGIAINICNDLKVFESLNCCGELSPKVDSLARYYDINLESAFTRWVEHFTDALEASVVDKICHISTSSLG